MKAAKQGRRIKPYFGAGFDEVGEMFSVFTPKRWELIGALRESGAITVAELARFLSAKRSMRLGQDRAHGLQRHNKGHWL